MIEHVNLGDAGYDIHIERGCLKKAGDLLDLDRKVLILTDDGVPDEYANTVADQSGHPFICTIRQGEENKTLKSYEEVLRLMLANDFSRKDCVVAVGGGICGDLAGFAAASYMRGIDFYNIPTTVLSQVDSSVGGKTAVNLDGIKNVVGAFYQPKKVLIDPDVLESLPPRHISAGLAEALKMAVTFDEELFRVFRDQDISANMERIIHRSLQIKKKVVEEDEKEAGLRKTLNFGHTIGHAIESQCLDGSLYHGECVAIGMIPMSAPGVREDLVKVLKKLHLPTEVEADPDRMIEAMLHDKKTNAGQVTIIETDRIGSFKMRQTDMEELRQKMSLIVKGADL